MLPIQLLYPMAAHVALTAVLYAALTLVRAPKVWGLRGSLGFIGQCAILEPRISANLSNQFEWPVLFYAACVLQIAIGYQLSLVQLSLAWVFLLGRIIHSYVQIFTANVRLRGTVFVVNFLAVVFMWANLLSCVL